MNFLEQITTFFFFVWIFTGTLFWVSLFQLKEYRFDRVIIHLKETKQGKELLFSYLSLLKWIAIFSFIPVIFNTRLLIFHEIFVFGIYSLQFGKVLSLLMNSSFKRPVFTLKAFIISLLVLVGATILFMFPFIDYSIWILLVDRPIPFLVAFLIFIFSFPTEIYRDYKIEKAVTKLRRYPHLMVIGVTGSYGKSSTKDFIAQVLSKKFKVVKTPGTNNTPIGIAQTILSQIKKDTQIFVVEMGAYKIGEIEQMCKMVHPSIGILTAVNNQHLSLFGSLENIKTAKYELIDNLPRTGIALFNGNNPLVAKMYTTPPETYKKLKPAAQNRFLYLRSEKTQDLQADIVARNIEVEEKDIRFDVTLQNKMMNLKAPLIGAQNIENILPAIFIAKHLKMSDSEIKRAVSVLTPIPKTMVMHTLSTGATLIDDTFNANPKSVEAAISYMQVYNGKKILVMQPIIELGRYGKNEHYELAKKIAVMCDRLYLTNMNFYADIVRGIKEANGHCKVRVRRITQIVSYILSKTQKGDIIVFEGKEGANVLNKLL